MDQITSSDVGIVGVLAILLKQHWPSIKSLAVRFASGVWPSLAASHELSDHGCVSAYNTLRPRLAPETAKTVWAEIEPKEAKS